MTRATLALPAVLAAAALLLVPAAASPAMAATSVTVIPGLGAAWGADLSPDGSTVAFAQSNGIRFFDIASSTFGPVISVGSATNLLDVVFSTDGTAIYAVDGASPGTLYGLSVATLTSLTNFPVTVGDYPAALAADDDSLYVVNTLSGDLTVVDALSGATTTVMTSGMNQTGVALNPAGTRAYLSNGDGTTLTVIDTAVPAVLTPALDVVGYARAVVVNPLTGSTIFTANDGGSVSFIDAANTLPTTQVSFDPTATAIPMEMAIAPDGSRVYVVSWITDDFVTIDVASRTVIDRLALEDTPMNLTLSADGLTAYVGLLNEGLQVLDLSTPAAVVPAGPGLAATGQESAIVLAAGMAALLGGALLHLVRSRRRAARSQS